VAEVVLTAPVRTGVAVISLLSETILDDVALDNDEVGLLVGVEATLALVTADDGAVGDNVAVLPTDGTVAENVVEVAES
jgi:hypothetical protein